MASYRIHRLKENQRQHFRWAPHTSGATGVKPSDYEEGGAVEAQNAYDAWTSLKDSGHAIQVGDLLEREDGTLYICKYVGFEEARWAQPEVQAV